MKTKVLSSILVMVFLTGSVLVMGQDRNEKKIGRLKQKIEKQSQKLHELTGKEHGVTWYSSPSMRVIDMSKINAEVKAKQEMAMREQRVVMAHSRDAMEKQKREMERQMIRIRELDHDRIQDLKEMDQEKLEKLKEIELELKTGEKGEAFKYYFNTPDGEPGSPGAYFFKSPDIKVDMPFGKGGIYSFNTNSQDNLLIEKELADESSSADFNFEVKEGAEGMTVTVTGTIDAGKVVVSIKRPDGELFNEYTLSPLANVNWRQNLKFEDMEEKEFKGKWTVGVKAEGAKGNYSVRIRER